MASIKNLKKDIHFLTQELASECMFKMVFHPEINEENINALLHEGMTLRDELVKRAGHADAKGNRKMVRAYYRSINQDLLLGFNGLFGRLAEVKK